MTAVERFLTFITSHNGCWHWTGGKRRRGYGAFWFEGKLVSAHRWAYETAWGPIPPGHEVDHRCFNESCVRPSHLRLASPKQNKENRRGANVMSKSGIRGVSLSKQTNRWRATVKHNGRHFEKQFDTKAEAAAAVEAMRAELFTHA